MKADLAELLFATRGDFRRWLDENAASGEGVWLILGKTKAVATLSATEALEEALCFGWVDGRIKSIDADRYRKYFSPRREQSPWSDKNKRIVALLRDRGLMTALGEGAVEAAIANGMWDASPSGAISAAQLAAFTDRLSGCSPALENFLAMPPSGQTAYVRWYFSAKKEETRQRHLAAIVELLNNNQKPTIGSKGQTQRQTDD